MVIRITGATWIWSTKYNNQVEACVKMMVQWILTNSQQTNDDLKHLH